MKRVSRITNDKNCVEGRKDRNITARVISGCLAVRSREGKKWGLKSKKSSLEITNRLSNGARGVFHHAPHSVRKIITKFLSFLSKLFQGLAGQVPVCAAACKECLVQKQIATQYFAPFDTSTCI